MTSKPLVYIAISPDLFEETQLAPHLPQLAEYAEVERWPGPGNPTPEAMQDAVRRAQVIITAWGTPALGPMLSDFSPETYPLRLVAHWAGSVRFLVSKELLQKGLLVSHANDSLAEAVAEFTIGVIIAMRRQMFHCYAQYKRHEPDPSYKVMRELPGSTIGIIGASAIGRRVMDLLRPWRVKILLYDPYVGPEMAAQYGAELVDLLELFSRSDITSLHAPITPQTINMIRAEHFQAMPDGALFVNTARGVLVDHQALLAELQTGRISAFLDVTDPTEPLPPDSPFFDLDNCVLIHHQAGASLEARQRQAQMTVEDVIAHLEGRPLIHRVPPERWETMA